jgi:hypothetical protein
MIYECIIFYTAREILQCFTVLPLAATSPNQISHPTSLYVLADIDLPAQALVPVAAVVGLASCGRLSVAREVAIRSSIRGDAYGAAMNELEEWRA